jgi:hypothetical protein
VAFEAERALPARNGRLYRDETAVLGPPRHLVAGHDRARDAGASDPALLVPVEVGPADAHGLDADEHLAGAGLRALLVVDADVPRAVQARRAHYFTRWP